MNRYINILPVLIVSIFLTTTSQASVIKDGHDAPSGFLYDFGLFGSFTAPSLLEELDSNLSFDILSIPTYVCTGEFFCPTQFDLEFTLAPEFFPDGVDFNYSITLQYEINGELRGDRFNSGWGYGNEHIFSQIGEYTLLGECDSCSTRMTVSEVTVPVSAPGTWALFASGLGLVSWSIRRRRAVNV